MVNINRSLNEKKSFKHIMNITIICLLLLFAVTQLFLIIYNSLLNKNSILVNLFYQISAICPIFILLAYLIMDYKLNKLKSFFLITILYLSLIALIGTIFAKSTDQISLFARFLITLAFPIILQICREHKISNTIVDMFFFLSFLESFILILIYFSPYSYTIYVNNISRWLTLNLGNPNITALILLCNIEVLLISILRYKNDIMRGMIAILCAFMIYFMILTKSRIALLVFVLFIVSLFVNFKLKNWHIICVLIVPVFFCLLYTLAYSIVPLRDLNIFGKPLFSGRIEIWYNLLRDFYDNPLNILFGNFSKMQIINAHNGALTILVNFGIVGLLLYFVNLYFQFKMINKESNVYSTVGNLALLCNVFTLMTESSFTTLGGLCLFSTITIMLYVNNEKQHIYNGKECLEKWVYAKW